MSTAWQTQPYGRDDWHLFMFRIFGDNLFFQREGEFWLNFQLRHLFPRNHGLKQFKSHKSQWNVIFDKESMLSKHLVNLFPQIHIQKQITVVVYMEKVDHNVVKGHKLWRPKYKIFIISASPCFSSTYYGKEISEKRHYYVLTTVSKNNCH